MKMANPRTEMHLATSLWGKANTHRTDKLISKENMKNGPIVKVKHETGVKQIREN
jgi:hypothetical protein